MPDDVSTRLEYALQQLNDIVHELHQRESQRNRTPKILLVDDDPNDVCLLCRQLDGFYCDVEICRDSEQARNLIRTMSFDFVILDEKMPKLSGLEILKETMPDTKNTQFFIVSGFQNGAMVNEVFKLGAMFLPKPVSPRALAMFLRPKHEQQ